jgi:hypothetical protein
MPGPCRKRSGPPPGLASHADSGGESSFTAVGGLFVLFSSSLLHFELFPTLPLCTGRRKSHANR